MTLMNSFTSVYGGFAVFTTIGFMAHNLNMSVDDVVQSGTAGGYNCSIMNVENGTHSGIRVIYHLCHSVISLLGLGLIFVVYPRALAAMPFGHFFSALFFLMVVLLGISSQVYARVIHKW